MKMYDQVAWICASNAPIWSGVPAFEEAHTQFTGKLAELRAQIVAQAAAISGVAENKQIVLDKAVALSLVASKALSALALKNGDVQLLSRNIYSRSEWFRGNALLRSARFTMLLEDVFAHATELEAYGIDAAFIASLQAQVNAYDAVIISPRKAILDRKRATTAIDRLVQELNALLSGHLDSIVEVFRENTPEFVEDYFNARIVVDLKGPRRGKTQEEDSSETTDENE